MESHRTDVDRTGVTVLEDARAVRYDSSWAADPSAGHTAESMAGWLSQRPFLTGAKVTPTTVDGRRAWTVSAQLAPGARLPAEKLAEGAVAPTFTEGLPSANILRITMGYHRNLTGDYTLVDVPGAGVTVIWSWAHRQPRAHLAANQPFIDGLSFG
jgi:hypothetical protein